MNHETSPTTYRGMRINGVRVALPGHPSTGGLGTAGPMQSGCNNRNLSPSGAVQFRMAGPSLHICKNIG
jgi:hypothetical protein